MRVCEVCECAERAERADGAGGTRSYGSWTQTEARCSMQTVTSNGLRPATEADHRYATRLKVSTTLTTFITIGILSRIHMNTHNT